MSTQNTVTIIGASVAGLFAALHLARQGVPVQLFESQAPWEPDERTLIVTRAFFHLAGVDGQDTVLNRLHAFELISRSRSARIPLREPDGVVDRARLLRLLARKVQEAGGEIFWGCRLVEITRGPSPYVLRFARGEGREWLVPTCRVIGADGARSVVARALQQDGLEQVALCQARVRLPADLAADTVRVWFDRTSTRFFYWLIPDSPHTGVAGLIAETPGEARPMLERFLSAQGLEVLDWQAGAPVPLFPLRPDRAPAGEGSILLAGDAAAQVKVTTVGGVVAGMRGALAAARSLLRHTSYPAELRSLHQELAAHALVRRVLDGFTDEDYDHLLGRLNRPARAVLGRYHRDELARALWPILFSQPRWLLLGARALVRSMRPFAPADGAARRGTGCADFFPSGSLFPGEGESAEPVSGEDR